MNLRCEYRLQPLGIDGPHPRLSWEVNDSRRGAKQTAYQIIVESDAPPHGAPAVIWDTGVVRSSATSQIVYNGQPLLSGRRYRWRVRTWDAEEHASEFSKPAWWEMGLLEPRDWRARWITLETPGQTKIQWGDWIWGSAARQRAPFFRRTFQLGQLSDVRSAAITLTADSQFVLHVNGRERGRRSDQRAGHTYDLRDDLKVGTNVIAIEGSGDGKRSGLLVAGGIVLDNGKTIDLRSDAQWRTNGKPGSGWVNPGFDDHTWSPASIVAAYGSQPWGQIGIATGERRSIQLRREFEVSREVRRARIYATGLGLYELRLDGEKVGGQKLAPEWTDYTRRVLYQTYDITQRLSPGRHAIGATLGNGWWAMTLGYASKKKGAAEEPRLILQLEIEYADGSRDQVVTDEHWRVHTSPIVRNSIYDGEEYDARLELPGWDRSNYKDADWKSARIVEDPLTLLVAQANEPIQTMPPISAVAVTHPSPESFVFDFGTNLAGCVRLSVKGPRGARVQLQFGELLGTDGHVYRGNLRGARAIDTYILRGEGKEVWEPTFTYHGFRFCEVVGYPGEPSKEAIVALPMRSVVEETGSFACSNELLNRIYRAMLATQRSNVLGLLTDCCQRDERLGWTGDAQLFAPTACWNMEMASLLAKWMRDVRDAQLDDGRIPDVVPSLGEPGPGKLGWGDSCIIIPWTVYQMYGDTRIIEDNFATMKAWLDYARKNADGELCGLSTYGDWIAPATSPKPPIANAYYYYSHELMGRMAEAIGRKEEAREYFAQAAKIAAAFNRAYWNEDTHSYAGNTQTSSVLPLYFGIVPIAQRAAVAETLARDVQAHDDHLTTGFVGTAYLLPVLSQIGRQDLAFRLAMQTTYPSWGYMLERGATTFWERWNGDQLGPRMNSHNQPALASMGRWFYESLGGLSPGSPGFAHVEIRPKPPAGLDWVRVEYDSPPGRIRSEWHHRAESFSLKVQLPPNTAARIHLPCFGEVQPTVFEGKTRCLDQGKPDQMSPGVQFLRLENGDAIFEAGSGRFEFTMNLARKSGKVEKAK